MASKELIEKVARVIADANPRYFATWDEINERGKDMYREKAQATISTILAALQEPTEGMLEAGCDQYDFGDQITQGEILTKEWRAMLNASALGEQSDG